jgi:hypothetical protein
MIIITVHDPARSVLTFQRYFVNSWPWWWKQQIPLELQCMCTKLHGVTSQNTALFHCPSSCSYPTCPVSFLLLQFPVPRSNFFVCSILLPAMDQWRRLLSLSLSLSCFIPSPRQKKPTLTILPHTLEACLVLLRNSRPGGMWVCLAA